MSDQRHRCPECKKMDGLWQEITVTGWREIDMYLKPTGTAEADAYNIIYAEDQGGCTCGWEGAFSFLEVVGIDDEPLPVIHPNQLTIEAA